MTEISVDGRPCRAMGFKVEVTNQIVPTRWVPIDLSSTVEVSATITVADADVYKALLGVTDTYVVEIRTDLNPNHRWARTIRQFVRQVRDIFAWEYRNAKYGALGDTATITFPNVRYKNLTIEGI